MAKAALEFEAKVSVDELNSLLRELQTGGQSAAKAINDALGGSVRKTLFLETVTDTSGAKSLVAVEKERLSVADQIERKLQSLKKVESGSITSLRQQVNEAKQARDGITKYQASVGALGGEVLKLDERWVAQNQKVQQLQRQLDLAGASGFWDRAKAGLNAGGLINFANGLTQITNGLQSASIIVGQVIGSFNNLFNALSNIQQFELTFKAIGATQKEAALAFDESSRIALGLGVNINTVRDAFQQLSPVVLAVGGSVNSVSQITEALSSRFVAFGLSGDKARRVMNGVIQAFGKGKLMAEELTQQISEADPAFRTDLANAIGVSIKELNELVKNGEITSKVLLEILPKLSKSSLLFGRLGQSAGDAASAFRKAARDTREGGTGISITVQQVQQQLENLNTINLITLSKAFEPLLASILEVTAVITDLSTVLINSAGFKTFAEFINNLSTQFAGVIKGIGAFLGAIAQIVGIIAGAVNAIDNFFNSLIGIRPIVGALAAIITTRLVVALAALSVKGVVGAAVLGIRALTAATLSFSTSGLGGLARGLGTALLGFAGFKKATLDQIKDNFAVIASTRARAAAIAQLRAAETAGGLVGGFGPAAIEAAGRRAAIKAAEQQAAANAKLAASSAAAGAASTAAGSATAAAGAQMARSGVAAGGAAAGFRGLGAASASLLNPLTGVLVVGGLLTWGLLEQANSLKKSQSAWDKFKTGFDGITERTNNAIDALNDAGTTSESFNERLKNLQETANKEYDIKINWGKANSEAKKVFEQVDITVRKAQTSVSDYSQDLDKTGAIGEKAAQRIAAAEAANQLALDVTRQKREELLDKATKGGKQIDEANKKELTGYQKNIQKLEEQATKIQAIKKEAAQKGISIEVTIENKAEAALEDIKLKTESLESRLIIEADPQKYAELREQLNGLTARLAFLKADRVQIQIDLKYKIDEAALKNALDVNQAITENLRSQEQLTTSLYGLDVARVAAKEQAAQAELQSLQDRDAGAIAIAAKENEIKQIQEQKRQIEAEAIRAQLQALPQINASELLSLQLTQQLAELEAQRLLLANQRLITEAKIQKEQLKQAAEKADQKGDTEKAQDLRRQAIIQNQLINNLQEEQQILKDQSNSRREINALQLDTLRNQQESKRLGLEAQLAGYEQAKNTSASASAAGILAQSWSLVKGNTSGVSGNVDKLTGSTNAASDSAQNLKQQTAEIESALDSVDNAGSDLESGLDGLSGAVSESTRGTADLANGFQDSVTATNEIASNLDNALQNRTVSIKVNYSGVQGLWTGGPTQAGQLYKVNELGQEGFLSSTGALKPINRPRNALWRAPSSGMVIPAHIMSGLNVPQGGVTVRNKSVVAASKDGGMRRLSRVLQAALSQRREPNSDISELASIQAYQAQQIGKLSRAVGDLAHKDWNVNVGLKVRDDAAYLNALNHKL